MSTSRQDDNLEVTAYCEVIHLTPRGAAFCLTFTSDQQWPLDVDITCGSETIARHTVEQVSREDLLVGKHFFDIDIESYKALDLVELRGVTVPARMDPKYAEATHADRVPLHLIGSDIQVPHPGVVEGWIEIVDNVAAPNIEILRNDTIIWSGVPRRQAPDGRKGFRVDLPDPEDWHSAFSISARVSATGQHLGTVENIQPIDRYRGYVDEATISGDGRYCMRGWVMDRSFPFDSTEISINLGGTIFEATANKERLDLIAAAVGTGLHGFELIAHLPGNSKTTCAQLFVKPCPVPVFDNIAFKQLVTDPRSQIGLGPAASPFEKTYNGSLDFADYKRVVGWMRCAEAVDGPLAIGLFIDGDYYRSAVTDVVRDDVGMRFTDQGHHGFTFEIPPYLACDGDVVVTVLPRGGPPSSSITKTLVQTPVGRRLNELPCVEPAKLHRRLSSAADEKLAYIVLNLNGSSLLTTFFASFERFNKYQRYEIIIVDHGSTDESAEVCRIWAETLPLRYFDRKGNFSFSESNNFAASLSDADILVFINNDIEFSQDVGLGLIAVLSDGSVGAVGVKLLDKPANIVLSPPTIQHLGVHFDWFARTKLVQPFESRYAKHLRKIRDDAFDVPAVTGALLACRKVDFDALGGFDEAFYYGYEDVDLGLRVNLDLGKRVVCANNLAAFHVRGLSRAKAGKGLGGRLADNAALIDKKLGMKIRRAQNRDRFQRPAFWSTVAPRIAFAVSRSEEDAKEGDFFTALELARELQQNFPCQIVFLDKEEWYDLSGIDVLVTMVDVYDLRLVCNAPPHMLRIGWARNWIDRWASRPWSQTYSAIWASSQEAADFLSMALARPVEVLRIATNSARFATGVMRPEYDCDYCFTGSYFYSPREIVHALDPQAHPYRFAIFGHGWDEVSKFTPYSRGALPYSSIPDVYASTKIVVDDANMATKRWGSVNSRVFDALAAGALVITNGRLGANEVFDGLLPSYSNAQELDELLWRYLNDEPARCELVELLRSKVFEQHTYAQRAKQVIDHLLRLSSTQLSFSIKIGAPREEVREEWGDYHFALGLQRALTRLGHRVRVDCLDQWDSPSGLGDDVVIVLRGLSAYKPKPHQLNVMWIISHPDAISRDEMETYDHLFVASNSHAETLRGFISAPITPLLQCADPELFGDPSPDDVGASDELLFVGNSRNVFRKSVRDCIAAGLVPTIYGTLWQQFVPSTLLKGEHISNKELAARYRAALCVLNDHWDDMRRCGFISNRIFDAVACGAQVVSDDVIGMTEIFGASVLTYATPNELKAVVEGLRLGTLGDRDALAISKENVRLRHSFDARAREIMEVIRHLLEERGVLERLPRSSVDIANGA